MTPDLDQIRAVPKVLLHDHLDGGLRPATIVDLARAAGYDGLCGAERLGHGVRITGDITPGPDGTAALGRLAAYVRDRRIALEMCPTSNVQTGAAPSVAEHPAGLLRDLSFRVTVNTDNRLMSGVTLSEELHAVARASGYGWAGLEWLTINAMKSAFAPFDQRVALIESVIMPGFAAARRAAS